MWRHARPRGAARCARYVARRRIELGLKHVQVWISQTHDPGAEALPGWLHLPKTTISTSPGQIAKSVLISWAAGYLSRRVGERTKGRDWYETRFVPKVGPWALYGLLLTTVILFALRGDQITSRPWDVARIALPELGYLAIMWAGGYVLGAALNVGYERTTTLAFTAAGNNFTTDPSRR